IREAASEDLRGQLAVVQREAVLLPGTVRENLRIGRPGASDEEIVDAARRSGADEFITVLPDGYDTPLGRDGAALTEGQRRRLAAAGGGRCGPPPARSASGAAPSSRPARRCSSPRTPTAG